MSSSTTSWHGDADAADTAWLVKGMLPEVGTALLSGQWGMYKSFTLLDLSASLITGQPFAGHRVARTGGVLVLAAEGANTFRSRLAGLVQCGKLPAEPQPFAWRSDVPSLLSTTAPKDLAQMVAEVERQMMDSWGVPLVLIAVDTLAAAANFTDESDAAQGQKVMCHSACNIDPLSRGIGVQN